MLFDFHSCAEIYIVRGELREAPDVWVSPPPIPPACIVEPLRRV